ncbi:MAG: tetratricopeptide repeat protein, partial [Gemmatimonadota bacterium]
SERDKLLVEAMWSWRRGDGARAEDLYRTVLGTWPDDVEAWYQLAEVLNHFGPMRGGSISDSRAAFQRVLRFEPEHLLSLWHVARIDAVEGQLDSLDARIETIRGLSPEGDRTLELMAMRAASHDPEGWPAILDSLRHAQDITRYFATWNVAVFARDVDRAREIVPTLLQADRSREVQATGHLLEAVYALAQGRPAEAEEAMRRLEVLDPDLATSHSAAFALLPFMDTDASTLRRNLNAVLRWAPRAGCLSPHPVRNFEPGTCIRPVVRSYLAGMLEARLGRADDAMERIEELRVFADAGQDQGHAPEYATGIEAEMAFQRGDTAAALEVLEASPGHVWYIHALQSFLYSHSLARFRRAQALAAMGRSDEAIRWYSSFAEMSQYDLVLLGPALVSAGRVAKSLGRNEEAGSYYRSAMRYLEGGEGVFEGMEREAREGDGQAASAPTDAEDPPSSSGLAEAAWQLVEFQSMSDEVGIVRPDDPSLYTLSFSSDGSVSLRLDCTRGTARWSVTPASPTSGGLEFGPIAGTSASCPPPSMGERVARDLDFVRSYIIEGDRLYLSLMADGGIYVWERTAGGA